MGLLTDRAGSVMINQLGVLDRQSSLVRLARDLVGDHGPRGRAVGRDVDPPRCGEVAEHFQAQLWSLGQRLDRVLRRRPM